MQTTGSYTQPDKLPRWDLHQMVLPVLDFGCWGLLPQVKSGQAMLLTTYLHLISDILQDEL